MYKFGGQPFLNEQFTHSFGPALTEKYGQRKGRTLMEGMSGAIVGVGEIVLLPLDGVRARRRPGARAAAPAIGRAEIDRAVADAPPACAQC